MLKVDLQTEQAIQYLTQNLTQFARNKAIREGLGSAAKVFESYGRANLAVRMEGKYATGATLRSFRTRVTIGRKSDGGPTAVAGLHWPEGYKAHWLDLGTEERFHKKIGKNGKRKSVGRMPANYFFTDARTEGEKPAMDAIYDGIQRAIDRINSGR